MAVALLTRKYTQYAGLDEKNWKVGRNTGNLLFFTALHSIIQCDLVSHEALDALAKYDDIITTDLIWLRESDVPNPQSENLLKLDRRIVPVSVGLQAPTFKSDFQLQPQMVAHLAAIQERSVLAVRGQFTAEILNKHGIRNLEIVGCPSVYQLPIYSEDLAFLSRPLIESLTVGNHRTLYGKLSDKDVSVLQYMRDNGSDFIEQTLQPLSATNVEDEKLIGWMNHRSYMFFDQEAWVRHMRRYTFSYGLRFHGNVAALLAGVPALFVTIDSRTQEMTDFFKMPRVFLSDFDTNKILAHQRSLADYTEFRGRYPAMLRAFVSFLARASLPLRPEYAKRVAPYLAGRPAPG